MFKLTEAENRTVVIWSKGEGKMRVFSIGTEFQLCKMIQF